LRLLTSHEKGDGFERLLKIIGEKPKNELYYLPKDPKQLNNVYDENRDVAVEIHRKLVKFLEIIGTKEEILRYWRKLA